MYTVVIVRPGEPTIQLSCNTQEQVKEYLANLDIDECSAIHILFY